MKKILSIFVAVMAVCSLSAKSLYFNSGSWASEPGRFAIYCITGESWVGLEAINGGTNMYSAEVADSVTQVVFCRMNPELPANEWASLWNQTEDLTIPEGKDLYTITGWGEGYGAKATGEWSKYGETPQVLANGYYLMGTINGAASTWDYAALKAEHIFVQNTSAEVEEYSLDVTLAENDEIQVVSCNNGAVGDWYPGGEGNNYKVDAAHAGAVTIYFRPGRNGGDDWWWNCIYVAKTQGISNTAAEAKAVKTFVNGQLVIIKGDKVFNAIGTQIQ